MKRQPLETDHSAAWCLELNSRLRRVSTVDGDAGVVTLVFHTETLGLTSAWRDDGVTRPPAHLGHSFVAEPLGGLRTRWPVALRLTASASAVASRSARYPGRAIQKHQEPAALRAERR
jgi:hypothetical protein